MRAMHAGGPKELWGRPGIGARIAGESIAQRSRRTEAEGGCGGWGRFRRLGKSRDGSECNSLSGARF